MNWGDDEAARFIFQRFRPRLLGEIERRIGTYLGRRLDQEDILQSAFCSFFRRAKDGQYQFDHFNALCQPLLTIAENKTRAAANLTHDARRDFIRPGIGMSEISSILDRQTPAYHFFGHTGRPFERMKDPNGATICSKLSDFEWEETDRGGCLKDGCFGILRWRDRKDHDFEVVEAPWIKEYTPHTWLYL
jgi:hypothetical protein